MIDTSPTTEYPAPVQCRNTEPLILGRVTSTSGVNAEIIIRRCNRVSQVVLRPDKVSAFVPSDLRARRNGHRKGNMTSSPLVLDEKTKARFWAKVQKSEDPNGCWLWAAAKDRPGYGHFRIRYGDRPLAMIAHRVAYLIEHGSLPSVRCICHRCDIPACCNPAHLFAGTDADNSRDMDSKGRRVYNITRGEENGQAKLTDASVRLIRAAYTGAPRQQMALARQFGVSRAAIGYVVNNKSWRHVV